jgi:hypothetical protein
MKYTQTQRVDVGNTSRPGWSDPTLKIQTFGNEREHDAVATIAVGVSSRGVTA